MREEGVTIVCAGTGDDPQDIPVDSLRPLLFSGGCRVVSVVELVNVGGYL